MNTNVNASSSDCFGCGILPSSDAIRASLFLAEWATRFLVRDYVPRHDSLSAVEIMHYLGHDTHINHEMSLRFCEEISMLDMSVRRLVIDSLLSTKRS